MQNRFTMYQKTRPKPSSQSRHRVESIDVTAYHPLLRSFIPDSESQLDSFRKEVHAYRPTATIWEIRHNKEQSAVREIAMNET